jgi:hypothetical protein
MKGRLYFNKVLRSHQTPNNKDSSRLSIKFIPRIENNSVVLSYAEVFLQGKVLKVLISSNKDSHVKTLRTTPTD